MTRSAAPIAALLAALTLAACGTTAVSIRPAARSFTPDDYDDIYGRWTRAEDEFAFGRLEDILHVTATFESWEFRWAYVIRYAADYALQTEERTRLLRSSLASRGRAFVARMLHHWAQCVSFYARQAVSS